MTWNLQFSPGDLVRWREFQPVAGWSGREGVVAGVEVVPGEPVVYLVENWGGLHRVAEEVLKPAEEKERNAA